jgi:NAD(P)-dependent dehydrogenase (short-subunit alcohol dehydrogenase family)
VVPVSGSRSFFDRGRHRAARHLYARAVVPFMKDQKRGVIVNNASDWGLVAGRDAVAYCCSKGAVVMLTKAIAVDHAADGIRCNAICPGDTLTPMVLEARAGFAGASSGYVRSVCWSGCPAAPNGGAAGDRSCRPFPR